MAITLLTTEDAGMINVKLGQLQETIDKLIGQLETLTSHTGKINNLMIFLDELEKVNGDRIKAKYESESYKNKVIQEYLESRKRKRQNKTKKRS